MPIATSYVIENDRIFAQKLTDAARQVGDLRIPLTLISRDFFRSQRAIWKLKSPGQYPDLADGTGGRSDYKTAKRRAVGFVYPILKREGTLEKSMTNPTDVNAVNQIVNKTELFVGTKVPYGIHHQFGAPKANLPMRKFLFIGPEAPRFALSAQKGRLQRWIAILEGYVNRVLRKRFGV